MTLRAITLLGASSMVASYFRDACKVSDEELYVIQRGWDGHVPLRTIDGDADSKVPASKPCVLVCLAPIWALPEYFAALKTLCLEKIVAVSSTSRFTKARSRWAADRALARKLADAEDAVIAWARREGIGWVILRPTLVYGGGRDRNVSDIARFVRRWRMFPVVGGGSGLRQPLHSADFAEMILRAARDNAVVDVALNVCGGEALSYRSMVLRVAAAMECRVVLVAIPRWLLRGCVAAARLLPRFRTLSPGLADRMTDDLVVDGAPAAQMLGVSARPFVLADRDIPF